MPTILIIGATRGLGQALLTQYASDPSNIVYGTTRSADPPKTPTSPHNNIHWVPSLDLLSPDCGTNLANYLGKLSSVPQFSTIYITAGVFTTETLDTPNFSAQQKMFTTSCIAPTLLVSALSQPPSPDSTASRFLPTGSKIVLVTSESGSLTLRQPSEGGGNFGHHASKAAANMVARLLALDLRERGVVVVAVHPGFMRTEMTKGVGYDKFWEEGGAVPPEVAAESLREWVEGTVGMEESGRYWAPRGTGDVGTWEETMGKKGQEKTEGAVELPW